MADEDVTQAEEAKTEETQTDVVQATDTGDTDVAVDGGAGEGVSASETQQAADQTAAEDRPSPVGGGTRTQPHGAQPVGIDIDAEFTALDDLNDKLDRGEITYEQHAKESAKHNKAITQAQRQLAAEALEPVLVARANKKYWAEWGKSEDIASKAYGKSIPSTRASALWNESRAEIESNPRLANRPEMDMQTLVYARWIEKLDSETKKGAPKPKPAPATTGTRVTSATGGSTGPDARSARQKLDQGAYGDLVGQLKSMGL